MAVFSTDLSQTVEVLLERKNYNSVKDILSTVNPADIAVIFRDQPAAAHAFSPFAKGNGGGCFR